MSAERQLSPKARKRWRIAVGLGTVLLFSGLAWIWFFYDAQRQDKFMRIAGILFAGFALFLVWVLFGSGWRPRVRWVVFAGTLLAIGFAVACLRITGVSGDLVPIVGWRWSEPAPRSILPAPGASANTALLTNSYPQFLGPGRNGVLSGPRLGRDWKQSPPIEVWRRGMGAAWSGFAIQETNAITQEQNGEEELVVCYDLATGAPRWSHSDRFRYATTVAGEGPRATPTIDGSRVYTMGGAGILNCLDLTTGKIIWSANTLAQRGIPKPPIWGAASSPLVTERAVIVTVGGEGAAAKDALVSYDRENGQLLWSAGIDVVQWSSPVRAILDGVPQVLTFNLALSAHDEQTGQVLWQHPWSGGQPRVTLPLVLSSNRVLLSTGYGIGSELLEISREKERWRARRLWKSIRLKSKFANLFHIDGYVYGLDDGALACIDVATGDLKWKGDRYGHGQMILAAGLIVLMSERGDVVLVEPNPAGHRELTRFKAFDAKTWNPPALAGDMLVVRNDREAACFRLPLSK